MKYIELAIAALLLICLFPMPYGYYTFVRFIAMAAFAYFAYSYYVRDEKPTPFVFIFGALALLFQPFVKITLGRVIWDIVDVAVAILLVVLFFYNQKNKQS
ncbi:MAG: hypothetical protein MJZ86_07320 [Bacteroidales bacterium]|nr:hypothetical protein [Bacteroidales bacterium]